MGNNEFKTSMYIVKSKVFLMALAAACFAIPPAGADERTVKVGVYENEPKVFTSESGKPAGIFIDIIEYVAKIEGWKLRYASGSWAEGLSRLEKGEIDLMPDVAFTTDRETKFTFHKVPLLSSWSQVYARKGNGIKSILDLDGKRVAVLERSVQQEAFDRLAYGFWLNVTLIPVPDYKTMFELVAKNEADAAITNRFYGLLHAKKVGLEDTAVLFDPSDLFFAASRNAPRELLEAIDRHLANMKKDPQSAYYESLRRWTSEEVRFELPAWLQVLGLVGLVVLLVSLAGSSILKRQVDARTRELKQINAEMERRIVERTAELAAATEEARAADRIKSAFLATMSHELRTPLNSIIGFTGILLQGLAGPLNQEQQKQLGMVQNSSRHLLALINDVLDISKIEAGQLTLSIAAFQLKPSLEKMARLIQPLADKKGLELQLRIADDVGSIESDQRRLEQVALNLLSNAVKFTEKGRIEVECRADEGEYILSVADTGIGIPVEELSKLFQPFHQIDSGLARKSEGTGLGLSICKRILDLMGGSIAVHSRAGKGSTFTIRIPKKTGAPA